MSEMSFRDYQKASIRTMPKMVEGKYEFYYSNESVMNYALGLGGECGEVQDIIKKALFHGHPLDDDKLIKELGDVLHYLSGLCTMMGFSLEQVATANIQKLMERYPGGFSKEDSRKRKDERKIDCNCGECTYCREKKIKEICKDLSESVDKSVDSVDKAEEIEKYKERCKDYEKKLNEYDRNDMFKIKNLLDQLTPESKKIVLKRWGIE